MTDFNDIRKKIELLKKYDTSYTAFGSEIHGYEINPVLSEPELVDFEKKEQIRLPKSYREYLKYLGNGGAGPAYGIYSLEEARNRAGWFPPIADLNNRIETEDFPGELLISHNGCALFTWLAVVGPFAGELWYDGSTNGGAVYRINDDFLEWYKNWVDSVFLETGFITYLGNEAVALGQKKQYKEAIALFKLAVNIEYREYYNVQPQVYSEYLKIFCNVLYFLQNDNTGLPVDTELNAYFLEKCLSHGKENPAIYFNAACVYAEMKDFDNIVTCIEFAEQYYDEYQMMMDTIKTDKVFSEFRKDVRFLNLKMKYT